ncbi:MAG: archaeosine biosynthesis radical SAM protein RaSEA [Candidatus Thorarchaeota archaeon]
MNNIQRTVQEATLRARGQSVTKRRKRDPSRPSAKWIAPARVGREKGMALAIVLSTIGCAHARSDSGGCTMCSYLLDGTQSMPSSEQLVEQFNHAMHELEGKSGPLSVKIYTSGSFLDNEEIPEDARSEILRIISRDERVREVVLESRPEYVQDSVLSNVRRILGDRRIEIGMGLESASDTIRSVCINKSFDLETFKASLGIAKAHNIGMRAYVLLKPPLLTERDSLRDAISTIRHAQDMGVTTVSLNPVNVQNDTLVEKLWNRGKYRPPWLWSVLEVLLEASNVTDGWMRVVCDPVAGGKRRGAHNCGKCDNEFIQAIRDFSINQDPSILRTLSCDCRHRWEHVLTHEDASQLVHR